MVFSSPPAEADMLPCEYCQASCSLHSLLSHQAVCEQRPRSLHKNTSQRSGHSRDDPGPATAGDSVSDRIPCQFCGQQIPFKNYIRHEVKYNDATLYTYMYMYSFNKTHPTWRDTCMTVALDKCPQASLVLIIGTVCTCMCSIKKLWLDRFFVVSGTVCA